MARTYLEGVGLAKVTSGSDDFHVHFSVIFPETRAHVLVRESIITRAYARPL